MSLGVRLDQVKGQAAPGERLARVTFRGERERERECVCLVIFSPWSHQPVLLKSDLQEEKCYFIRRLQVSTIRRQLLMMVLIVSGVSRVSRIFLHTGECAVINQVVHYILGQPNYTPGGRTAQGLQAASQLFCSSGSVISFEKLQLIHSLYFSLV